MSKQSITKSAKKFFNIDKESRKHYPKGHVIHSPNENNGIPVYAELRTPRAGMFSRGIYSSKLARIV